MIKLDDCLKQIKNYRNKYFKVQHDVLHPEFPVNLFVFDWSERDSKGESFLLNDLCGDGFPKGFSGTDKDTLIPFALIMYNPFPKNFCSLEYPGQFEGMLFFNLKTRNSKYAKVIYFDVNGTLCFDDPTVAFGSFQDLGISKSTPKVKKSPGKGAKKMGSKAVRLVYKDRKSDKYWHIIVKNKEYQISYGRTGTAGQQKKKIFSSTEEAKKQAERLIIQKLKKGYI